MFLYSIEGSIPASAVTESEKLALAQHICAELRRFDWEATIEGSVVSFLNNKNIFHQMVRWDRSTQLVDSGEFTIGDKSIQYRLVTSNLILWAAILPLPLVFAVVTWNYIVAVVAVGLWLLSCVGETFWISFRIRRALRRAAGSPSPSLSP